jgi:hypothetical protein
MLCLSIVSQTPYHGYIGRSWRYISIILELGTSWRWLASFTLLPLYSISEYPAHISWESGRTLETLWKKCRRGKYLPQCSNSGHLVVLSVASQYTGWASPTVIRIQYPLDLIKLWLDNVVPIYLNSAASLEAPVTKPSQRTYQREVEVIKNKK